MLSMVDELNRWIFCLLLLLKPHATSIMKWFVLNTFVKPNWVNICSRVKLFIFFWLVVYEHCTLFLQLHNFFGCLEILIDPCSSIESLSSEYEINEEVVTISIKLRKIKCVRTMVCQIMMKDIFNVYARSILCIKGLFINACKVVNEQCLFFKQFVKSCLVIYTSSSIDCTIFFC